MNSKTYQCDQCGRMFSRKANALRHSNLVHANSAHIVNNFLKKSGISYKSHNKFKDYDTKFETLEKVAENTDDESCVKFSDYFSLLPKDIKIIKIINQLIRPFRELEDLLDFADRKIKAQVLWDSFCACLQTHNPVKSLNETVELYRSIKSINKIASYMPQTKTQNSEPILILKQKIEESYIFKRYNK